VIDGAPAVLSDLWNILPLYPADANPFLMTAGTVEQRYPELWAKLSDWARDCRLIFRGEPAAWVIDTALETLRSWKDREKTAETVRKNAPEAERKWRQMHERAGQERNPEREADCWRLKSRQLFFCVDWSHPLEMHDTYPVGSPEHFNAPGESEAEAVARAFRIEILPWNKPGGEERRDFRCRANEAIHEHERRMMEWTGKADFCSWHHVTGLALWQAGASLETVHQGLASAEGLNLGSPGDVSGITRGLDSAASFLRIDRRK
jgi:hypothetical protein